MAGFDSGKGPEGVVVGLIESAVKALDAMSDAAGEVAPDVGDLANLLVEAQRIADRASLDLKRLAEKAAKQAAKQAAKA